MDQPDAAVAEIRAGLAGGEMIPWYQPVVALDSQQIIGVEALVRWHRGNGVIEQPATFLPLAERSDLILDIDREILRQAFRDLAGWQRTNPAFRVSVNLSGRHLDRVETLAELDLLAQAAGVSPDTVDLELTETARPLDLEAGAAALALLRERGYSVWFDDFGSGWSALQDLIRFPVDGIKLDRTFAEQLGSPVADAVVGALAAAAAQVGLKITIEGIQEPRPGRARPATSAASSPRATCGRGRCRPIRSRRAGQLRDPCGTPWSESRSRTAAP